MNRRLVFAAAWLLAAGGAAAQPGASFEVASVKVSQTAKGGGEGSTRESIETSPGSLSMHNVSLRSAVRWAYGVTDFQISSPGWMSFERYDIAAKASGPVANSELRRMLRTLLASRFQMTLHHDSKNEAVYALVVAAGGARLEASKTEASSRITPVGGALEFRNMSMAELAERMPARPFRVDRPVIDRTGLEGAFDFTLKLADNASDLKSSLERREAEQDSSWVIGPLRQLGLRLEAQKGPVEMLVIDHAEKVPGEN